MPSNHCPPNRRGHTWGELPFVRPSAGGPSLRDLLEQRTCKRCGALGRVNKQGAIIIVEAP